MKLQNMILPVLVLLCCLFAGCAANGDETGTFSGRVTEVGSRDGTEHFTVVESSGTERTFLLTADTVIVPAWDEASSVQVDLDMEVEVTFSPSTGGAEIAPAVRVLVTSYNPDPTMSAKPVIYLYPEVEMEVNVRLDYAGTLTTTWPVYDSGWTVTAAPDGTLTDAEGQTYSYLFWEGVSDTEYDLSQGFVVAGADTGEFLRDALSQLGLTPREYNEFIVYWLPMMEHNAWNLISFQGASYTDSTQLEITPTPDSLLRVFMAWMPLETPIDVDPQTLSPFVREGFTVVEWGGAQVPG